MKTLHHINFDKQLKDWKVHNHINYRFPKQFLVFALNIARGMDYLASKKIVHR